MSTTENIKPDPFLWVNNIDGIKKEFNVELFLFNKNYTPYAAQISSEMQRQLPAIFLYDIINALYLGSATGMSVVDIINATSDKNQNVLCHVKIENVGRAETLIHLIETRRDDIVQFDELEHNFKRIKGVVARFTRPDIATFYVIKLIKQTETVHSGLCWQIDNGVFDAMKPQVAFKIPTDNQVLIVGNDIFVFNQAKFATLFKYDVRALKEAEQKGAEIDKKFKLNMPTIGQGIAFMATSKSSLLKKLLAVDVGLITQDDVVEIADEMQIELMTSDDGAIILMDDKDVNVFLDILLDNFMQSDTTGNHYLVKNKKPIELAGE